MKKDTPNKFTIAFPFTPDLQHVFLVEKNRPAWQAGHLNGIGGHKKAGESYLACCIREVLEEANIRLCDWRHFGTMTFVDATVKCYAAILSHGAVPAVKSRTDEPIRQLSLTDVVIHRHRCLSNIPWLVNAAFEHLNTHTNHNSKPPVFNVSYKFGA